jgi:hypothetical protein
MSTAARAAGVVLIRCCSCRSSDPSAMPAESCPIKKSS